MVRFSAYVIFMACFSVITFFILGPCSTIGGLMLASASNSSSCTSLGNPQELSITSFMQNNMLGVLSLAITTAVCLAILYVSGFSIIYIVPILLIQALLSFFIFPFGLFLNSSLLPNAIGIPLIFIFNVLMILAVADFIKGGA